MQHIWPDKAKYSSIHQLHVSVEAKAVPERHLCCPDAVACWRRLMQGARRGCGGASEFSAAPQTRGNWQTERPWPGTVRLTVPWLSPEPPQCTAAAAARQHPTRRQRVRPAPKGEHAGSNDHLDIHGTSRDTHRRRQAARANCASRESRRQNPAGAAVGQAHVFVCACTGRGDEGPGGSYTAK